MLLILMVTSKGMAGVPRASLVVIAATLAEFNIPEAGLLLIMGVDQFLDMGRSATNVDRQHHRDRRSSPSGKVRSLRARTTPTPCAPELDRAPPRRRMPDAMARAPRASRSLARAGSRAGVWLRAGRRRRRPSLPARCQGARERAVTIGYRETSIPFSYLGARRADRLFDRALPRKSSMRWARSRRPGRWASSGCPVTSETRIDAIAEWPGGPRMRIDDEQPRARAARWRSRRRSSSPARSSW